MIRDGFYLNNKYIRWENLSGVKARNQFEQSSLTFLQEWISGQKVFLLQTSGSTGKPKKIKVLRSQMEASARQTISFLHLDGTDRALVCLSTDYIAGKMMLVRAMLAEMDLFIQNPSANPLDGLSELPTFFSVVPLQLQHLLPRLKQDTQGKIKAIIVGGAAVSAQIKEHLKDIETPVFESYGMTETVSHVALRKISGKDQENKFKFLDGICTEVNEHNCLRIYGAVTNFQWIQTHDVVRMDKGYFEWIGRSDNVINSGGVKIQLEVAENKVQTELHKLGQSNRILLSALPDEHLGSRLILLIEGHLTIPEKDVLRRLRNSLPKYQNPKSIDYLPLFKVTKTGKIQRKQTLQLYLNSFPPSV